MPDQPPDRHVVYSSDGSGSVRYCRRCGQPAHEGRCATARIGTTPAATSPRVPVDGYVRISRTRKNHGGKTVTVVTGIPGTDADRDTIAHALKKLCGAGGARKDEVVEVQGDQRDKIATYLTAQGYRVKLAGG